MDFKKLTRFVVPVIIFAIVLFSLLAGSYLVEEVRAGEYHIVQYPSGKLVAKMEPGWYGQWFGTVTKWPKAFTLNFDRNPDTTVDSQAQNDIDITAIEVRFADGTIAPIEGSLRGELPRSPEMAVDLVSKFGYRSVHELVENLVARRVRVSVNSSATMMTAIESSSSRRNDFIQHSWDQIQNGLYHTNTVSQVVEGQVKQEVKVAKITIGPDGNPIRQNETGGLDDLGVVLSNFEIKSFIYPSELEKQIASQRDAIMAISVARANAEKANEEAKTSEAQGKAKVMTAQYEEEQMKIRATVKADQEKAVALIMAEKEKQQATIAAQKRVEVAELEKEEAEIQARRGLEVAKLNRQASEEESARIISLGAAEAKAKQAVFNANGALTEKLKAWTDAQVAWAQAYGIRRVPGIVLGTKTDDGTETLDLQTALSVKLLNDLNLDLGLNSNTSPTNN